MGQIFFLGFLAPALLRVSEAADLSADTVSACVNKDADVCEFASWQSCIDSDTYLELCCWSCQTVVLLEEDASSCYIGGWNDVMTNSECANAALTSQMNFIILNDENNMDDQPVGCSKLDETSSIYQWNPALRADDYDPSDFGDNEGPLRVCLRPRRTTAEEDLRVYVPAFSGMRTAMDIPQNWDNSGNIRFLENSNFCSDVQGSCQIVPDEANCLDIADELNLRINVESDEYVPGGCFYYDGEVVWNSGDYIKFPPTFTTAYYSQFCHGCKKESCPLPLWAQLFLVALSLTIVFVCVVVICFNLQNSNDNGSNRYEPGVAQFEPRDGEGRVDQYNFGNRNPNENPARHYPYRLSDTWDMPTVPMNLYNEPGL